VEAREVRNKVADYGCHCIVCGNRGARVKSEAVGLEMEMQKQMAMQLLGEFGRRGRERGCDGSGREGKAGKKVKRSIKTDDRQLKAQDKSLKISTKENRCVCGREGRIRTRTAATSAVGLRRGRRGKNGRGEFEIRAAWGQVGKRSWRLGELRGERTTGP
jgi:hypothetical protein